MRRMLFAIFSIICMILVVSCKDNKIKLSVPANEKNAVVPSPEHPGGTWILGGQANKMIKNFRTEIQDVEFPIKTDKDQNLRGFFVSREVFDSLVKNPDINGFMFYFAKHDNAPKKVYTLVIVGTKMDVNKNTGTDGSDFWEEIDPCPDKCGTSGN